MKNVKRIGFATALLCVTSLLIAAFMVLFNFYGSDPNDESKVNTMGITPVAVELKTGMVNFGKTQVSDANAKKNPEKFNDAAEKIVVK